MDILVTNLAVPGLTDVVAIDPQLFARAAKMDPALPYESRNEQGIEVIPLSGVLTPKGSFWGTSTDWVSVKLAAAVASPNVTGVILDIDSPGGAVTGTGQLAKQIYEARKAKPIVAVANSIAASAAYWIGAAASHFIGRSQGDVGSIGVIAMHMDVSQALEREGIKVTVVSAGENKAEGAPFLPLSESAIAHYQERVNEHYNAFVASVAKSRGVNKSEVLDNFGQGRVFTSEVATGKKMLDGVGGIPDAVKWIETQNKLANRVAIVRRMRDS